MTERIFLALLFCVFFCGPESAVHAASPYQYVRIPASAVDPALYERFGFIRDHKSSRDFIFGYFLKAQLNLETTVRYGIRNLDEAVLRTIDFDPVTLNERTVVRQPRPDGTRAEPYHSYATLTQELQELAANYPHLVRLESAGKSVEGRELWIARVSNDRSPTRHRPKLLYISSMHGDEVTGKEMMIYFLRQITRLHGTDRRLTLLADNAEIFIMPSMNPDGTEAKQRFNANYVDLNRDFPKLDDPASGGARKEPETEALMELFKRHHFQIAMNFHGGELCVNIPWDSTPNLTPGGLFGDNSLIQSLAHLYASTNRPMYANHHGNFDHGVTYGYEWFQVLGGMQDWSTFFHQTTHATLEISEVKWPSPALLPQFWDDNRESILAYLEGAMLGIHVQAIDETGNPIAVSVSTDSSPRLLHYPDGFVHRPTIAGAQQVTFQSPGAKPVKRAMIASYFSGQWETVVLSKRK